MFHTTLFTSAALLSLVSAHGIVQHITANGKTFTSPQIGQGGSGTGPFWLVSDNSPVADPTSAEALCGRVANKPSTAIEVPAGTTLSYYWSSGYSPTDTLWPHNTGPMFWYMAKCDGDCNAISGSTKFFKLQQDGFAAEGVWKQADLKAGKTVSFTIPQDLEPGNYVIRHEVLNLASTAEQFPSCANFKVTGSGNKALSGASTTFPGAYKLTDPGLAVAGSPVYSIKDDAGYVFPGPVVAALGQGSGSDSGSSSTPTSTSSSVGATSTPTQTATSTDANNGAGSPPSTGTSTQVSETPSETPSQTDSATSSASSPTGTPSTGSGSCAEQWTACNANYHGTADDVTGYNCQKQYNDCVAASFTNHTAKRMHRRRRALFDVTSH